MARLKGNTVPLFTLKNGASALVDLGGELVSYEFVDGEGAQVTFSDYAAGTPAQLNVTFALDFSVTSAHQYLYSNSGALAVDWVLQPATGTVTQTNPKFSGKLTMPATKPRWGNSAGEGTENATFDVEFALDSYAMAIV